MSESSGEKTEEPTDHRLKEARKKGQVPQRKNSIEAVFTVLAILLMIQVSPTLAQQFIVQMTASIDGVVLDFQSGIQGSVVALQPILITVLAITAGFSLLTLFVGLFLNGFNFSAENIAPKFEKLNPVSGLKQMFSLQTLYNFGRLLLFFVPVTITLYLLIWLNIETMIHASECGWTCVAEVFLGLLTILLVVFALLQVVLGALDHFLQNILFRRQNKMTKDDVKREHKQNDGDPQLKGTRKSIAQQDALLPHKRAATHVIVGENILVALIYYPQQNSAAYMLFKHKGTRVADFANEFRAYKCPVVVMPNQARRLFSTAPVGQYLPMRTSNDVIRVDHEIKNRG